MSMGRIIVPVCDSRLLEGKLDHALAVAQCFASQIDVLFLHGMDDPGDEDLNPFFGENARGIEQESWADDETTAANLRTRIDAWTGSRGLGRPGASPPGKGPTTQFIEIARNRAAALLEHGRTSDLIVIGQPGRGMRAAEGTINKVSLVSSGRIVLLAPAGPLPSAAMLARVLLAWDGSAPIARTLAQALPLLAHAEQLRVFTAGDASAGQPDRELVRHYLRCSGLDATFATYDQASPRIGKLLLETARQQGASMVCMGAYRHSRTEQRLIGGNTWHIYTHSPLPVLFGC